MKLRLLAIAAVASALAGLGAQSAAAPAASAYTCYGTERWPIKTLSDPDAGSVTLTPVSKSVLDLWALQPPAGFDKSIRNPGAEMTTYRVTARLVRARWVNDPPPAPGKHGGDLDIHLVIAPAGDPTENHTLVVEFPFPQCVHASATLKARMTAARESFLADCGLPGRHFHDLSGTATIRGVGFFDRPHASGAAEHGFELHPVLHFNSNDCAQQ